MLFCGRAIGILCAARYDAPCIGIPDRGQIQPLCCFNYSFCLLCFVMAGSFLPKVVIILVELDQHFRFTWLRPGAGGGAVFMRADEHKNNNLTCISRGGRRRKSFLSHRTVGCLPGKRASSVEACGRVVFLSQTSTNQRVGPRGAGAFNTALQVSGTEHHTALTCTTPHHSM